ncbi:MAG TPA: hypothetical protein VEH07_07085, partial [Alphaproteobacteria bacterium]|nr:hypothetical protein [Alphaproteobacteria bacterium]
MLEQASGWRVETFSDRSALETFIERAHAELAASQGDRLRFVAVDHEMPNPEILVLARRVDGHLLGLAALSLATGPLVYSIGPLILFRWKVRKYQLYSAPISLRATGDDAFSGFFDALADAIGGG